MKNFKNVKNIQFSLILDGCGCVNFDSTNQVGFLLCAGIKGAKLTNGGKLLSNILLSKKNFRKKEDGTYEYCVKVSSECLRNSIFKKAMQLQSPTVMNIPQVLNRAIATPDLVLRGYLYTEKDGVSIKKKSPFFITDAEDKIWKDSISVDFHTRSGEKELNNGKDSNEAKDTSVYNIENVGSAKYFAKGGIDVQELRFISADPLYDRMAVNVDGGENEKIYMSELEKGMVNFKPEMKYYYLENSYTSDNWAERGILLNDESVDMLIKRLFKQMLEIEVVRCNAYLKTEALIVTVNCEGGEKHEIEVNLSNYNDFTFECVNSYKEADETKICANKELAIAQKEVKKSRGKKGNKENKE